MKTEKKYSVVNNEGEVIGHDLNYLTAQDVLAETKKSDPQNKQEWEIIEQ